LGLVELNLAVCHFVVIEVLRIGLAGFKNTQKVLQNLMAEVFVANCAVSQLEGVGEEFVVLSCLYRFDDHVGPTALQSDADGLLVLLLFKAVLKHAVDDAFLLFKLVSPGNQVIR